MFNFFKSIFFFFFIGIVSPVYSLEKPMGENLYPSYEAISNPVITTDALSNQPIAVGSIADRGGMLDLKVRLIIETPADLYLALYMPELDPSTFFFFTKDGGIAPFTNNLLPWKQGVSEINETVLENIPNSILPFGDYYFYLLQTNSDSAEPLKNYNLWSTYISTKPQVIETGDPEMPVVVINPDGNVISFRVDSETNQLTGLSFNTQDGQQGFMAINAQTGLPDYWYSDDTMLVYNNIRMDEGLMDLGVVYPDGSTAYLNNLTMDKALLADLSNRSNVQKRGLWSGFVGSLKLAEKVGTVVSAAACGASLIVTGGAAAAGIAGFIVPPVSGAFFTIAVTASGVAVSCTTALVGLAAMKLENTKAVGVNDAIKQVGLPADVLECISAGAPNQTKTIIIAKALHCFKALSDASSLDHQNGLVKYDKAIKELQAKEVVNSTTEAAFEVDFSKVKRVSVSARFNTNTHYYESNTDYYGENVSMIIDTFTGKPLVELNNNYEKTEGSQDSWIDQEKLSITMNPSGYHITNLIYTQYRVYQVPKDGRYDTTEFVVSGLMPLNDASEGSLTYIVKGTDACDVMTKYVRNAYAPLSYPSTSISLWYDIKLASCSEKSFVRVDFYNY